VRDATRLANRGGRPSTVAFPPAPSDATWSAVPLADDVYLGLGSEFLRLRSARELRDPEAWNVDRKLFRGDVGPFSALDFIAEDNRPLRFSVGRHPHCASPPVAPPRAVASLKRLSVQPQTFQGCLQWFTVDGFVTREGEIKAATLDLWEP
jgi:hypothetical protein